ncbi:hypothetical protein QYH69_32430 [Paraburkholderia sp. SARCC-3016]|uniref:hypothetical protein n=1 Tax=Paraburkholderia sp. SARCC-3016 TaxID=3058611 RepID=UPI002809A2B4|nr:hypothetical protein [Paraburkholderia sp. SARCC-3016]MDQ7981932.1 hypothetical protein [Paraburkholderia sp. SARCC-3016]
MQLIIRMFHRSDLSRSRAMVQDMADDFIKARRKHEEIKRKVERALEDAIRLEGQDLRMKFERRLQPQSAFLPTIIPKGVKPTPFDAWESTRATLPQPKGRARFKPAVPFPIRPVSYSEQAAA